MSRVVHFEIHATNPEPLVAFYTSLFGWTITKWDGPMDYYLISTGPAEKPGINGGLMRRHGDAPAPDATCQLVRLHRRRGVGQGLARKGRRARRHGRPADHARAGDRLALLRQRPRRQHLRHDAVRPGRGLNRADFPNKTCVCVLAIESRRNSSGSVAFLPINTIDIM